MVLVLSRDLGYQRATRKCTWNSKYAVKQCISFENQFNVVLSCFMKTQQLENYYGDNNMQYNMLSG